MAVSTPMVNAAFLGCGKMGGGKMDGYAATDKACQYPSDIRQTPKVIAWHNCKHGEARSRTRFDGG